MTPPTAMPTTDASDSPAIAYSARYRWYVLSLLMVVFAFSHMDRNIIGILLNSIIDDLHLSDTEAGAMSGLAFAIFYATLGIPVARLADRANRVRIITVSLGLWSLMTALTGLANNFWHLLLARIGVGVGEAGCVPPSHSIVSDYFPLKRRAFALAVYNLGIPLGTLTGVLLGGYINDLYNWRVALYVVGMPGLLAAALVLMTVREPIRGHADGLHLSAPQAHMSFLEVMRFLIKRPSLIHLTLGSSLIMFGGYGSQNWIYAFFERSHGLSTTEISVWLGPVGVLGGIAGTLFGGAIADRMGARDPRWYTRVPAIMIVPAIPVTAIILLLPRTEFLMFGMMVPASHVAMALMFIPIASYTVYLGPTMAVLQLMAQLRMRATIVAVFLLITNLIGMGLGPLLVGVVSDFMEARFGAESLRYTMLGFLFIYVWAAIHFARASKHITRDLADTEAVRNPASAGG